ncbi:hypothetical protein DBY68_016990 [Pseudocitrobacter sp. RIT415]|nr:hypothetical protein DBY68_016990 [Pseudocitrobacter sp. RIT 415]
MVLIYSGPNYTNDVLIYQIKKVTVVNNVHIHLQSGIRNGVPVVACTLNYGAEHPLHLIQVDRHMPSMEAANAFIAHADRYVCRSILSRLSRTEESVIAGVNRVFGASDAEAAIAFMKIRMLR